MTPAASSPSTRIAIVCGLAPRQRLRGEHVLDLAGADAERQRPEGAVRGGVRVAAHDGDARRVSPLSGPITCTMPALVRRCRMRRSRGPRAVGHQGVDLRRATARSAMRQRPIGGGDAVVHGRQLSSGPPDPAPAARRRLERLRRGDLVDAMEVDEQEVGRCRLLTGDDDVGRRDSALEEGPGHRENSALGCVDGRRRVLRPPGTRRSPGLQSKTSVSIGRIVRRGDTPRT